MSAKCQNRPLGPGYGVPEGCTSTSICRFTGRLLDELHATALAPADAHELEAAE